MLSIASLFWICIGITINTFTFLLGFAIGSSHKKE